MDWEQEPDAAKLGFGTFTNGMKILWRLCAPERNVILLSFLGMTMGVALDLTFTYIVKLAIDALPAAATGGSAWRILSFLLAMLFLKTGSIAISQITTVRWQLRAMINLGNIWPVLCHTKLLSLSLEYHERHGMGRNVAKITKGCDRTEDTLANTFFGLAPGLLYWMLNLGLLLWMDWRLAAILIAPIPFGIMLHARMSRIILPLWATWDTHKEKATSHLIQSIVNAPTVQSYVQEHREICDQKNQRMDMRSVDSEAVQREWPYYVGIGVSLQFGYIAAIAAAILFVREGSATIGTVAYVMATGLVTIQHFWDLIQVYRRMLRDMIALERLQVLLEEPSVLANPVAGIVPEKITGDLLFSNISFRYPGKEADAISDIRLTMPVGSMTALVGKSGEGKTTLAKLLMRAYDPTGGAVMLDGQDVRTLQLDWYRRRFATVRQEVDLFDATIRDNICYGHPSATDEEVWEAARAAHLINAIEDHRRFPLGLLTLVGERGVRLSGGERQRVGIARAYLHLLLGACVLILDEATSNLDSEAERAIQKMVQSLRRKRQITILAIAHRLSTIKNADRIYVLNEGRIAECGSHHELLAAGGAYAKFVELQDLRRDAEPAMIP